MYKLKLQFWSFDIIFAIIIFGIAITIVGYTWYNISSQLSISYGETQPILAAQAQSFAQSLLTQGYPADWQSIVNFTVPSTWSGISVGLLGSGGALSSSKILALYNYQATKFPLGIIFDYFILIYNNNINITIGRSPFNTTTYAITSIVKKASLNGQPVTVKVLVWASSPIGVS